MSAPGVWWNHVCGGYAPMRLVYVACAPQLKAERSKTIEARGVFHHDAMHYLPGAAPAVQQVCQVRIIDAAGRLGGVGPVAAPHQPFRRMPHQRLAQPQGIGIVGFAGARAHICARSEEHTSELQSLMRISYAVFCLKKKKKTAASQDKDTQ